MCIGFVRSQFSTSAWTRCARPAARRGRLCPEHREGFEGAVLGMLEIEVIRRSDLVRKATQPEKSRRKKTFTCVGRAQRCGGNNDARAARTGPGTRASRSHIAKRERDGGFSLAGSDMNELRTLQITRAAETSLAECERKEAALLTVGRPGKKGRAVSRALVCARLAKSASKERVRQDAAVSRIRRPPGSSAPQEKPAGGGEGAMVAVEKSVAELVVMICEDAENREKRQTLAEALRERGLNESKLAAMYSGLAEKLSRNKEQGAVGVAAAKLLFDVLKELADWLEPETSGRGSDVGEAPRFVRLIHNVPRPVRTE